MRKSIVLAAILASACKPVSQEPEMQAAKPALDQHYDIPQDQGAQVAHIVTRDIPPGGEVPWHTHPGVEIAYVESGVAELTIAGKDPQLLNAGESFMAPRGIAHSGRNPGDQPARLVITYIVDKDAPLRTPADAPD